MSKQPGSKHFGAAAAAWAAACLLAGPSAIAQTPEQQKTWEAERALANAAQKAQAEELARQRAARKAEPMAWVRTLDPMGSGGWDFRTVAPDGSWAIFSTTHQMTHSGSVVSVWLRREYAEPQRGGGAPYLSFVEKVQFDCRKVQTRVLVVVYYAANNIQGSSESETAEPKDTPWSVIVPGTKEESTFQWACAHARS